MQWWWTVGDNWGCNDDGISVRERLGSVDIKIKLGGGPLSTGAPYTNDLFKESPYTQSPSTKNPLTHKPATQKPRGELRSLQQPQLKEIT